MIVLVGIIALGVLFAAEVSYQVRLERSRRFNAWPASDPGMQRLRAAIEHFAAGARAGIISFNDLAEHLRRIADAIRTDT